MRRREYISAIVTTVALCGCSQKNQTGSPPAEPAETPKPKAEAAVVTDSTSIEQNERNNRDYANISGEILNTGTVRLDSVVATGSLFGESGNNLIAKSVEIRALSPDEIWEPWLGTKISPTNIGNVDFRVTGVTGLKSTVSPSALIVRDTSMEVQKSDTTSEIRGSIINKRNEQISPEVRVKVRAENNHVMGVGFTNIDPLPANSDQNFNVSVELYTESRIKRVSDFDIVLTAN